MATTFSSTPSKVQVSSELDLIRTIGNLPDPVSFTYTSNSLSNGVAAGQADRRYVTQLSILASSNTVLNLSSLLDPFGGSVAFVRIKEIFVQLLTITAATSILVGGAATNGFANWLTVATTALRVRNGMCFYLGCCPDSTGYPVVATTGDQLKIANEDAVLAATVNVSLVGCSA
jgi:hypothetical protein